MTAYTTNGALTLETSFSANTDLFSKIGSLRGKADDAISLFAKAYAEDKATALRILLWARDARGGAGERETFRNILSYLVGQDKIAAVSILMSGKVAELGRFDDYVQFLCDERIAVGIRKDLAKMLMTSIISCESQSGLIAKWLPRKGKEASIIRGLMGLAPKEYRKMLVANTNVVETQMCAKNWDSINFAHVPSVAMSRYLKAFYKNAEESFKAYKEALVKGAVKAKADALYPYDVIRSVRAGGDATVADAQWNALPNFLEGKSKLLPIIDVSGSMEHIVSGSVSAMDIAIALGIYVSERQEGCLKNVAMTFESNPSLFNIVGDNIAEKYIGVKDQPWGGSTNLQASFELLLKHAKQNEIPSDEMPEFIFIISDMGFDTATSAYGYNKIVTNYQAIDERFQASGYKRPNIIFWNVNAPAGDVQTTFDENGTAMISGFSPSILKSVLNCESVTPYDVMMATVAVPRYDIEGLTK